MSLICIIHGFYIYANRNADIQYEHYCILDFKKKQKNNAEIQNKHKVIFLILITEY